MVPFDKSTTRKPNTGIRGALLTGVFLPVLFAFIPDHSGAMELWRLELAIASVVALLLSVALLARWIVAGKIFGIAGCGLSYAALLPGLSFDPTSTLLSSISIIWIGWLIFDYQPPSLHSQGKLRLNQLYERSLWGMRSLILLVAVFHLIHFEHKPELTLILTVSTGIALVLFAHWAVVSKTGFNRWMYLFFILLLLAMQVLAQVLGSENEIKYIAVGIGLFSSFLIRRNFGHADEAGHWWELFLDNPARVIVSTFLLLCVAGTVLLKLPVSAAEDPISLIDACFTSVSAVCVTGLVVLDTPVDFSFAGQAFILLLIQLGGLGIMSVASLAMNLLGKRFSLQRERVFAEATQTDRAEMKASLVLIFKCTMVVEMIGAIVLGFLFFRTGDSWPTAIWRGLFTSISGFCNAGFALQSDSLIPYQSNPLILHVIAILIIVGGMAPITVVTLPKLLRGKRVTVESRIAWITSASLLMVGMVAWLVFEWNGLLSQLSFWDKLQNAWFQSATLRTAGFNSIDFAKLSDPMLMFSVILMFIGGSPGGTAGGIKTTTFAVLMMTFWMRARNRKELIYQNRCIQADTVYQAITILVAGLLVWTVILLMLDVTQSIPMRQLAFEVTSAIGTVGLTMGATPLLDEIGKIIIIMAMFAGRIGPLTFFMVISDSASNRGMMQYPKAEIHIS